MLQALGLMLHGNLMRSDMLDCPAGLALLNVGNCFVGIANVFETDIDGTMVR